MSIARLKPIMMIACLMATMTTLAQGRASLPSIRKADSLFFAGDYQSAKEMYSKVLRDTSKNGGAWSRYGYCNLNAKNYDGALTSFEKALANHPARPVRMNTFASLARVHSVKRMNMKALTELDSAVTLGYGNLNFLDTQEDFNNIRGEEKFKMLRQKVYLSAFPCMADAKAREFDFWIGDWDVYVTGTKTFAGHNKIEMISGGCALLENWESKASNGKSINFIDPVTQTWKQTWVGSYQSGIQEFVKGAYKDGAMRFVFQNQNAQGDKIIGSFIFYNEKPGQVRQFNEASSDGGKTWTTSYDYTYLKKQ